MEKYRIFVLTEQMKELVRSGREEEALAVADKLEVKKVRGYSDLKTMADLYLSNGILGKAKECLIELHDRNKSRSVVMQLINLTLRLKDPAEAEKYAKEFKLMAPDDYYNYIFRYNIDKLECKPVSELIESLEKLRDRERIDNWDYELAKLYHKSGAKEKCIAECKDIAIWFGSGEYVDRAKALLAYYSGELDITKAVDDDANDPDEESAATEDTGEVQSEAAFEENIRTDEEYTETESDEGGYQNENISEEPDESTYTEDLTEVQEVAYKDESFEDSDIRVYGEEQEAENFLSTTLSESLSAVVADVLESEERGEEEPMAVTRVRPYRPAKVERSQETFEEETADEAAQSDNNTETYENRVSEQSIEESIRNIRKHFRETDGTEAVEEETDPAQADEEEESTAVPEENEQQTLQEESTEETTEEMTEEITEGPAEENDDGFFGEVQEETSEPLIIPERFKLSERAKAAVEIPSDVKEEKEEIFNPAKKPRYNGRVFPIADGFAKEFMDAHGQSLEDYFGFMAIQPDIRSQLVKALDILLNPQIKNISLVITGGKQSGRKGLCKGVVDILHKAGFLNADRYAVTDAMKINGIEFGSRMKKLLGSCLVIDRAGMLSGDSVKTLLEAGEIASGKLAVILIDSRAEINKLFRNNREINSMFPVRIHIPSLDKEDIEELAYFEMEKREVVITLPARELMLKGIDRICRLKKDECLATAKDMIDKVLEHQETRTAKRYIELTLQGKLSEQDNIIMVEDVKNAIPQ